MRKFLSGLLVWAIAMNSYSQENAKMIYPPNAPYHKTFGTGLGILNGNKMAIGASFEQTNGVVYFFDGETYERTLAGKDVESQSSHFGEAIAMTNSYLMVGAPSSIGTNGRPGKVYVFHDPSGIGNFTASGKKQTLQGTINNGKFGEIIKMVGDWMAISERSAKKVHLYKKDGPSNQPWQHKQTITTQGTNPSLSLSYGNLVIGDPVIDTGNVIVFERKWVGSVEQYVQVYNRKVAKQMSYYSRGSYGTSVDIQNNLIVVSDPVANIVEILSGGGSNWTKIDTIMGPSFNTTNQSFGTQVAIKQNYIAILSKFHKNSSGQTEGAVHLYTQSGNQYLLKNKMVTDHQMIKGTRMDEIIISDDATIAVSSPASNFFGSGISNDRGMVFFGNLSDLTKSKQETYEYNNSRYNATTINLFEPKVAWVYQSNDDDYYKFTITNNDYILLELQHNNQNFKIELFDANGNKLASSSRSYSNSPEVIIRTLNAGTYYVRVYGVNGAYNSNISYQLLPITVSCADLSGSVNNNFDNAIDFTTYQDKAVYGGIKTNGLSDYYSFTAGSSGTKYITLQHSQNAFRIELYNQNKTFLKASSDNGSGKEALSYYLSQNQKYFIRVYAKNGQANLSCYNFIIGSSSSNARQADITGTEAPVSVRTESMIVFPNLINSGAPVNLSFESSLDAHPIQVIEASTGRVIIINHISTSSSEVSMELPELKSGIYFINAGEKGKAKFVVK